MKIIDKINKNKELITSKLYDWAETFNPENIIYIVNSIEEEEEDEMFKSYFFVKNLAVKLEQNKCNDKDYEDIIFHIDQINHNKIVIKL